MERRIKEIKRKWKKNENVPYGSNTVDFRLCIVGTKCMIIDIVFKIHTKIAKIKEIDQFKQRGIILKEIDRSCGWLSVNNLLH